MLGLLAAVFGTGWTWLGFGLPLGLNSVEGGEAALLVGASAARGGWRKAWVATIAALITLVPFIAGLYFLFKYFPGEYIDYAIACVIFALGLNEVREGLSERPKRQGGRLSALDGPVGIDPADPASVTSFQKEHGLEGDGEIGPQTRGALLAALADRGEEPRPNRLGIDVTDEESVRRFQRAHGLAADGVVGPQTQGALAAEAARPVAHLGDADAVGRFQREHDLEATGDLDDRTRAALRAVEVERRGGGGGDVGSNAFPVDVTSAAAIQGFQRSRGLEPTGTIDRRTQGALRAEFAHAADAPTTAEQRTVLGIDPTDPESIGRFQALHGLEQTGEIDEETRMELQRTQAWVGGVDPTDPDAVVRFQLEHGLEPTGVVDAETQGALRSVRERLVDEREHDEDELGGRFMPLDPTDSDSIRAFQRERGLDADGVLGPRTQAALRAVVAERRSSAPRNGGSGIQAKLGSYGAVWPAYVGGVLESGEAVLYTFGVANGSASWIAPAIGGAIGFMLPWAGLVALRNWVESKPEWVVELSIGIVLMVAASTFGVLRATGIFGG